MWQGWGEREVTDTGVGWSGLKSSLVTMPSPELPKVGSPWRLTPRAGLTYLPPGSAPRAGSPGGAREGREERCLSAPSGEARSS